ncbi:MAG: phosphatidylglycerol lysyltransferase domain-containing protein [Bdellovibrionota bacterium]
MTLDNSQIDFELPLSWRSSRVYRQKKIYIGKKAYLPWIDLPESLSKYEILKDYLVSKNPDGFVLRGCFEKMNKAFMQYGGKGIALGESAELSLPLKITSSLRSLIKRGERKTQVIIVKTEQDYLFFLNQVKTLRHLKNKLQYLFRNNFNENDFFFACISKDNKQCLALLNVSRTNFNRCHMEVLIRDPRAPVGVMEFLIYTGISQLSSEQGLNTFSLGEAPMILSKENSYNSVERFLTYSLRTLAPRYNFTGLRSFKQKFSPEWKAVYWYGWPNLDLKDLFRISLVTNAYKLALPSASQFFNSRIPLEPTL